jgi:hypothetical protein
MTIDPDASNEKQRAGPRTAWDSKRYWLILTIVWALSLVYTASYLNRGWIPYDEGGFAQSAERVLHGELPHRDFDEPYTGGVSYLHSLAFRVFGVKLTSMRLDLFALFVIWVPALFYVASRFVSAYAAGALTILCVVWSVPNYPSPVMSWYNLFFAVFGTAALLRYIEVHNHRWLFVAGFCGGLSILAKIAGLYYVVGAVLFLIFYEQSLARHRDYPPSRRAYAYIAVIIAGLFVFIGVLADLIHKVPGVFGLVQFVVPALALVILILSREFASIPGSNRQRFSSLFSMSLPFMMGVVTPCLVFVVPYLLSHSVTALLRGVFIIPARRLAFAMVPAQTTDVVTVFLFLVLVVLIALASDGKGTARHVWAGILVLALAGALWISAKVESVYEAAWFALAISIPASVAQGAALLGGSQSARRLTFDRQQQLMLMLCVTGLVTLVQFPFSAALYFCYVAPFAILAAACLLTSMERTSRLVLGVLLVFYLLFGVRRLNPILNPPAQTARLTLPRVGGLSVYPEQARLYQELIPVILAHAVGAYTYATPDCPEVYYLSGLLNPTRTQYDFFDDTENRTRRILGMLENHNVNVVVINEEPAFSQPVPAALLEALDERFAHSTDIGHFEVRWAR